MAASSSSDAQFPGDVELIFGAEPPAKRSRSVALPDFEAQIRRDPPTGEQVSELHEFSGRPVEICYSFKDTAERNALLAGFPRQFEATGSVFVDPTTDLTVFGPAQETLPARPRNLNVLLFEVDEGVSLPELWLRTARSVRLPSTDQLNLYRMDSKRCIVLFMKDDNRAVSFPEGFRFQRRHMLPCHFGRAQGVWEATRRMLWSLSAYANVSTLYVRALPEGVSAVLAVCRDMTATERRVARLEARMLEPKKRSEFQRALVDGWGDIEKLLAPASAATDHWYVGNYSCQN
jgi:hypothetical protein